MKLLDVYIFIIVGRTFSGVFFLFFLICPSPELLPVFGNHVTGDYSKLDANLLVAPGWILIRNICPDV